MRPHPVAAVSGMLSDDELLSGNESGDLIANQQRTGVQQPQPSGGGNGGQTTAPSSMNSAAFSRVAMASGVMSGISSGGLSGISSGGLAGMSSGTIFFSVFVFEWSRE